MATLADDIRSMYKNTKEAYDALEELGATMPEQKNLENLALTIDSLSSGPAPEPGSIEDLKDQLDKGTAEENFPVGTEIPDTWNNEDNPLIVGTFTTMTGADGQRYKAVGLLRKYVDPGSQAFNTANNTSYPNSLVLNYLNGEYLDKCSDSLKAALSEVSVKWYDGSTFQNVSGKWHLPSSTEVFGAANPGEGEVWKYWKDQSGATSPSDGNRASRIRYGRDGGYYWWWLRSIVSATSVYFINFNGGLSGNSPTTLAGLLPECYILGTIPQKDPLDSFKEALDNGTAQDTYPVGTEIEDDYDGHSNPLIVAQYLDSSNNSLYGDAEGVILLRKYAEAAGQPFGAFSYSSSSAKAFLDTTYLSNCSEKLKSLISDITVSYYHSSSSPYGMRQVVGKWFLMSQEEVYARVSVSNWGEGIVWDYWKKKTGLSNYSDQSNAGRVPVFASGATRMGVWLRSMQSNNGELTINDSGGISTQTNLYSTGYGILPACFIAKSSTPPQPANQHTVKFYPGVEGAPTETVQVEDGQPVQRPNDPTSESGCKFLGWKEVENFNIVRFEPGKEGLEPFEVPVTTGDKVKKPVRPRDPSGQCHLTGWKENE